jgi:inner centromere protein
VSVLHKKISHLETEKAEEEKRSSASLTHWMKENSKLSARMEEIEKFFRWNPEANTMHLEYLQAQRQAEQRRAAEQKRQAEEREQQQREERERQAQANALEEQREQEAARARELAWRPRGMGMDR